MRNRLMALFVVIPVAIGLSACGGDNSGKRVASGGGPSSAPASGGPNATMNPQDAQLKFAQCMRENGVNMPDPRPGEPARISGANGDQAKLQAATQKCQPILQQGGGQIDPKDPAVQDALVKFTKCMREHGVNIPDPGPDGKMQVPSGSRAKLQEAQRQCQQHLPGGGPK